jgi:plasmid stabilization system protein ParE
MRVRLTPAAEAEVADARDWYQANTPRVVERFLDEFEALTLRLADSPAQFPAVAGAARRAGFRRFPYGLFFVIDTDEVRIFACFHASREPRRWEGRI